MPDTIFEIQHLQASYGTKRVLEDIHLSIKENTLNALIGVNGSGKTTLLRCIAQRLKHEGNCLLLSKPLENLKPKELARQISYLPQRFGLSLSLPVLDFVLLGYNPVLQLLENPNAKQKEAALQALQKVGLSHQADDDFLSLSEGQKQLAFLARTMIEDTSLWLLDEPDSALDFENRHLLMRELQQLHKTALLCLHDPTLAFDYCDQICLMKDGKIVATIHPKTEDIASMQAKIQLLFSSASLTKVNQHIILLWEGQ